MGLFGKNKKMCPNCGKPAAWFLATKVEGQPLCDDCASKGSKVPIGLAENLTLEELREFLVLYDENEPLRNTFQETYQHGFGFLGGCISMDIPNRLFRLDRAKESYVFEASNLLRFRVTEDWTPLFQGTKDELICYQSTILDRVENMGDELNRYRMEQRQYEQMKQMDEMLKKQAEERGETYISEYIPSPDVDRLKPFEKFHLELELDRPYMKKNMAEYTVSAPGFYSNDPSISSYRHDYEQKVADLREVVDQLMALLNPDAPERQEAAQQAPGAAPVAAVAATPAAPADPVAEIQRYKALMDSGVITEEEFTAKKRQLLGI